MRLVAGCARTWKRNSVDDFAVIPGIFIKVDNRQKIGIRTCLISGPDEKKFLPLIVPLFFSILFLEPILCGSCSAVPGSQRAREECDQNKGSEYYAPVNIGNCFNHELKLLLNCQFRRAS